MFCGCIVVASASAGCPAPAGCPVRFSVVTFAVAAPPAGAGVVVAVAASEGSASEAVLLVEAVSSDAAVALFSPAVAGV